MWLPDCRWASHITWILGQLHWVSEDFWAQVKMLVLTYKAGPLWLRTPLSFGAPLQMWTWTYLVFIWELIQVTPLREVQQLTTREKVFSVVASFFWNILREICLAPSLTSFQYQVKMYLFCQPFNEIGWNCKLLMVGFFAAVLLGLLYRL